MNLSPTRIFKRAIRACCMLGVLSLLISLVMSVSVTPVAASALQTNPGGSAWMDAPVTVASKASIENGSPQIGFDAPDTAVCLYKPTQITVTGYYILPAEMTAVLQTQWYVVLPGDLSTEPVYNNAPVTGSGTFSLDVTWPGIRDGDEVVEIHIGAALLDPDTGESLSDKNGTLDYYWYPWVCAAPTATPTTPPEPTPTSTIPVEPTPTATTPVEPTPTSTTPAEPTPTSTATPDVPGVDPTPTFTVTPQVPGTQPTPTFTPTPPPGDDPTQVPTLPPPSGKPGGSNPAIIPVTGTAGSALPGTLIRDILVNFGIGLLGLAFILNGIAGKRRK